MHPVWGGLDMLRCDLPRARTEAEYLDAHRGATPRAHPDDEWILGGGWRCRRSPAARRRRRRSTASSPTARRSSPTATATAPGSTRPRCALAGIDRDTPDPADGRIERDAGGRPDRHAARGRDDAGEPAAARASRSSALTEALLRGPAVPALLRHHRAGRTPSSATTATPATRRPAYLARRGSRHPDGARRRRDLVGPHRGTRADPVRSSSGASATAAGASPRQRQDHAGRRRRELHRRRCSSRTATATGTSPTTRASRSSTPEVLNEAVPLLDARGLPGALPRDRRPRGARVPRRGRARDRPQRAAATTATTSRTSRSCIPKTSRASAQLGVAANMQSLWATLEPQMVELTLPVPRRRRAARGSTRSATCCARAPCSRRAATGRSRRRIPLAAIHVAVNRMAAPGYEEGDYDAVPPRAGDRPRRPRSPPTRPARHG